VRKDALADALRDAGPPKLGTDAIAITLGYANPPAS
jgi:hypothetical protein